jgi:hypothetical protein
MDKNVIIAIVVIVLLILAAAWYQCPTFFGECPSDPMPKPVDKKGGGGKKTTTTTTGATFVKADEPVPMSI